ncbi:MAG: leucine-rich repeat domain-containing protein [Muribaculaceae bacterium]
MKKLFFTLFSAATAFAALAGTVTVNGIVYQYGTESEAAGEATAIQCTAELPTVVVMENKVTDGTDEYVVTAIGSRLFQNKTEVTSITLPEGIKKIYSNAFFGTSKLEEIKNVPEELESLGSDSFVDSHYVQILTGEEGVYLFGGYAIAYIGEITTETVITFPENTKGICYIFFKFPGYKGGNLVRKVVLNEGLLEIQRRAFEYCYISEINIPSTVTYIDPDAFNGSHLEQFTVSEDNSTYTAADGILFTADMKTLYLYPSYKECESYIVPDGVTTINNYGFYGAFKIKELTICEGVAEINQQVIRNMGALETLHLPSTISNIRIGNFVSCSKLKEITLAAAVPPAYSGADLSAFAETTTLYVPEGSIEAYKADSNWGKLLNIKKLTEYSAAEMISEENAVEIARYDISGRILSAPQKGVNFVRMSDGKVKKVLVK